jgi:hypothetical protein
MKSRPSTPGENDDNIGFAPVMTTAKALYSDIFYAQSVHGGAMRNTLSGPQTLLLAAFVSSAGRTGMTKRCGHDKIRRGVESLRYGTTAARPCLPPSSMVAKVCPTFGKQPSSRVTCRENGGQFRRNRKS